MADRFLICILKKEDVKSEKKEGIIFDSYEYSYKWAYDKKNFGLNTFMTTDIVILVNYKFSN